MCSLTQSVVLILWILSYGKWGESPHIYISVVMSKKLRSGWLSRYSAWAYKLWFCSRQTHETSNVSKTTKPPVEPTQPPSKWVMGFVHWRAKLYLHTLYTYVTCIGTDLTFAVISNCETEIMCTWNTTFTFESRHFFHNDITEGGLSARTCFI